MKILIIKDNFSSIKRFATHCCLDNIKPKEGDLWTSNVTSLFVKYTSNQIVTFHLKTKLEQIFYVDITIKSVDLAKLLCDEGVAILDSNILDTTVQQLETNTFNDTCAVDVKCIYSPYCFYINLVTSLSDLDQFQQSLQLFYDSKLKNEDMYVRNPRVGLMYVAKFSEDKMWYRAILKEIDLEQKCFNVFFVDYGNEELLPLSGKNLMYITEDFKKTPKMALKCSLYGIEPCNHANALEVTDFLYEALGNMVEARFLGTQEDCHFVELTISPPINGLFNVNF